MNKLQRWNTYYKLVLAGTEIPKHTLCYELQKYARIFYVWYNVEDYKKLSFLEKVIQMILFLLTAVNWFLIGVNISKVPVVWDNFSFICKQGSFVLGGSLSVTRCFEGHRKRERLTALLKTLDKKVNLI